MKKTINFLRSAARRLVTSDTVIRAAHTFSQAFLAVWLVSGFAINKVVLTAALAAAISALKTFLVTAVKDGQLNIPGRDS